MLYYRVKKEYDQKRRRDGSILIANELYTPNELKKYNINPNYTESVNIKRTDIYFMFGAHFAN